VQKVYALFGDDAAGSPFRIGQPRALSVLQERFPELRHYRQFLRTAAQLDNLVLAPFCASAEFWLDQHNDPAPLLAALRTAAEGIPEVFAVNPQVLVSSEEHNISGEPFQDSGFKATFLFDRKRSLDLEDFHSYWLNHHGPIAAKTQDAERYVQSHIKQTHRAFDGITELFWPDYPTALASMASEQMTTDQANDAPNFVDGESLIVFLASEAR
jgi:uncharacterized protein (TIGR02118 family)